MHITSITRNLISLSKLDIVGYSFKFGNGCFSLFKRTFMIGSGTLYDGLYKLNLDNLLSLGMVVLVCLSILLWLDLVHFMMVYINWIWIIYMIKLLG